jgi:hypothetical protein
MKNINGSITVTLGIHFEKSFFAKFLISPLMESAPRYNF